MKEQTIVVEAYTLSEARQKLRARVPKGLIVYSETILSSGNPAMLEFTAVTKEETASKIPEGLPHDAEILSRKVISDSEVRHITLEEKTQDSARSRSIPRAIAFHKTARVGEIKLIRPGSDGFLGIGKRLNQYDVELVKPALVEIYYQTPARIQARVGPKRQEDWTLSDWVEAVRKLPVVKDLKGVPLASRSDYDDPRKAVQEIGKSPYIASDYITWSHVESKTEYSYKLYRTGENTWAILYNYEFLD